MVYVSTISGEDIFAIPENVDTMDLTFLNVYTKRPYDPKGYALEAST